ncbi:hypothetical protein M9434_000914 [Picochlorum sp. BPE23]|nr:hypothetical protein M9434_000914 [Picochlorum sp. BPE23]
MAGMSGLSATDSLVFRLPPFLFTVFCLTWSIPIFSLTHSLEWLNLWRKRNDVLGWSKGMKSIYRFKVLKVGKRDLYRDKVVYLCNHRSWADFMVDQYVTEGRTLFMSRWAVAYVFPLFMIPMWFVRAVLIFRRGSIANKVKFNNWIDDEWGKSTQTALGVYPEGHRSTNGESLPLKRGMLHYAYDRKIPVQIVIGGNKEAILSEKKMVVGFGQTVTVGYSDVIYPENFRDFEEFMKAVQSTWDAEWVEVFSADWKDLNELPDPEPFRYLPLRNALILLLVCPVEIAILLALFWSAVKMVGGAYVAIASPWNSILGVLFVAYIVLSFSLAWRPARNIYHIDSKKKD